MLFSDYPVSLPPCKSVSVAAPSKVTAGRVALLFRRLQLVSFNKAPSFSHFLEDLDSPQDVNGTCIHTPELGRSRSWGAENVDTLPTWRSLFRYVQHRPTAPCPPSASSLTNFCPPLTAVTGRATTTPTFLCFCRRARAGSAGTVLHVGLPAAAPGRTAQRRRRLHQPAAAPRPDRGPGRPHRQRVPRGGTAEQGTRQGGGGRGVGMMCCPSIGDRHKEHASTPRRERPLPSARRYKERERERERERESRQRQGVLCWAS